MFFDGNLPAILAQHRAGCGHHSIGTAQLNGCARSGLCARVGVADAHNGQRMATLQNSSLQGTLQRPNGQDAVDLATSDKAQGICFAGRKNTAPAVGTHNCAWCSIPPRTHGSSAGAICSSGLRAGAEGDFKGRLEVGKASHEVCHAPRFKTGWIGSTGGGMAGDDGHTVGRQDRLVEHVDSSDKRRVKIDSLFSGLPQQAGLQKTGGPNAHRVGQGEMAMAGMRREHAVAANRDRVFGVTGRLQDKAFKKAGVGSSGIAKPEDDKIGTIADLFPGGCHLSHTGHRWPSQTRCLATASIDGGTKIVRHIAGTRESL